MKQNKGPKRAAYAENFERSLDWGLSALTCWRPKALIKGHCKKLCAIDPYFSLDILVLESMMGDQGAGLIKMQFDKILKESQNEPGDLGGRINKLLDDNVMRWTRTAIRHELACGKDMVDRMLSDEVIMKGDGTSTPWLSSVLKSLELYICFDKKAPGQDATSPSSSSSSSSEVKRGQPALAHRLEEVAKIKDKTMEMLLPFACWRHLLSASENERVSKWRAELLKEGAVAPAPKKAESKKAPKKRKTVSSAEDVDAAALALLGIKSM